MKICKDFFLIALPIFLLASCRNQPDEVETIDGFDRPESFCRRPFSSVQIISLSDNPAIGSIRKVIFLDGMYFCMTERGVFCYSDTGEFIREISRKGKSLSEWITLDSFYQNHENNVCILDTSSKKILEFNTHGEFLSSSDIPQSWFTVRQVEELSGNKLILAHGILNDSKVVYSVESENRGYKRVLELNTVISTDHTCESIGRHPFSVWQDAVKFVMPFDNIIYQIDGNKVCPIYRITTQKQILSEGAKSKIHSFSIFEYVNKMNENYFTGVNNIYETASCILMTFFDLSFILIDKEDGQSYCFNSKGKNNITVMPVVDIIGSGGDCLIGKLSIMDAMEIASKVPDKSTEGVLAEIKKLAKMGVSSNPVLVRYEL